MGISKRMDEARGVDTASHAEPAATPPDAERGWGRYLGDFVYGGLDGIITTFAVVSGVAGAQLDARIILILGLANLFADGFSMGTGAFLSARSEDEVFHQRERALRAAIERDPQGQRAALEQLYVAQGYQPEEAAQMTEVNTRTPERWTRALLLEQSSLLDETANPLWNAVATFGAFVLAGALPLAVYLVGLVVPIAPDDAFVVSIVLSAATLFALGAAKVFVTRLNPLRSGFEMLVVGGLAAGVAYAVGVLLRGIGGGG